MKKSKSRSAMLIVLFLFTSGILLAQKNPERKFTLGVNAGPVFSAYLGDSHSSISPYDMKLGYMAGISAQLNFTSRFAIRWEVNYEKQQYTYFNRGGQLISIVNGFADITEIPPRYEVHEMNKIIIPVTLKYNFIQKTKTSVFIDMGTFLGVKFTNGYSGSDLTDGLIMGMGIQRFLCERINVLLEVRGSADDNHFGSVAALFGVGYKL